MATLYRAYGLKRDVNRYKIFSIYITAIIAVSGIAAHLSPNIVPILFTIYLVWSPWHYTGQNFGIAMMMLRRGQASPSRKQRNALYLSYIGSYLVWLVELDSEKSQDAMTLTIGLPETLAITLKLAGYLVFGIGAAYTFLSLSSKYSTRVLIAPMLLHTSQFLWFLLPGLLRSSIGQAYPATYFSAGILAFMHCAQYLWITSYFAKRETEQLTGTEKANWNPWRYFLILIMGGIALFVPGPWIVSTVFRHDLFESALIFMALVNIHHFMLDGAIWKLRDGRIARLLLGSTRERTDREHIDEQAMPDLLAWLLGKSPLARLIRYGGGALLVFFATVDQFQNAFTFKGSDQGKVELARSINANDSRVYFRAAQNLLEEGNQAEGIKELEAALVLNPRNLAALHSLAQQRMMSQEIDKARIMYQKILDVSAKDLSALNNLGLIAMSQDDWQQAYELFERAVEIDPKRWESRCFLGQSLTKLGQYQEATEDLEYCLAIIDQFGKSDQLNRLGMILPALIECYEKTDRIEEADALRKIITGPQGAFL